VAGDAPFSGWDNFSQVLNDPTFGPALRNTMVFTFVSIVLQYAAGLTLAVYGIFLNLGLLNSWWGLIIADSTIAVPFGAMIFTAFMSGIPHELTAAARIDGAGTWRTFWSVVLPVSRNAVVTVSLFSFLWTWSDVNAAQTLRSVTHVATGSLYGLADASTPAERSRASRRPRGAGASPSPPSSPVSGRPARQRRWPVVRACGRRSRVRRTATERQAPPGRREPPPGPLLGPFRRGTDRPPLPRTPRRALRAPARPRWPTSSTTCGSSPERRDLASPCHVTCRQPPPATRRGITPRVTLHRRRSAGPHHHIEL
jgi:hypothetical protein